jgi:TATA-binding protein-associated factor
MKTMEVNQLLDLFDCKTAAPARPAVDTTAADAAAAAVATGAAPPVGGSAASKAGGGGGGLKDVLANLEALWDESQYAEEFNLSSFLKGLK